MTHRIPLSLSLFLSCTTPAVALAQTAYLQDSGIVGEGTTLSVTRLPVADANGTITYDDLTIPLRVNAAGMVTVGKALIKPSPTLLTNNFIAGRYYVKYFGDATQFGSLSMGVGSGGSTVWSLVMDQKPDGPFPQQATWQTGAPAPDVAARLNATKVVIDPNDSYGVIDVGPEYDFGDNSLLAAKQVASNLTIISYTFNGQDRSTQVASIVIVLCADQACSNAPP